MRWAVLALLAACASSGATAHSGTGTPRVEVRIENQNWNIARVYVRPEGFSGSAQRVATVSAFSKETAFFVPPPTFEFYVTFLGDPYGRWNDYEVWYDTETCLLLVIKNHLAASYAIPCYGRG